MSHWGVKRNLAIYLRYHCFEYLETGFSRNFMRTMDVIMHLAKIQSTFGENQNPIFWKSPSYQLRGPLKRRKALQYRHLHRKVLDYQKTKSRKAVYENILRLGGYSKNIHDETLLECLEKNEIPSLEMFKPTLSLLKGSYPNLLCQYAMNTIICIKFLFFVLVTLGFLLAALTIFQRENWEASGKF